MWEEPEALPHLPKIVKWIAAKRNLALHTDRFDQVATMRQGHDLFEAIAGAGKQYIKFLTASLTPASTSCAGPCH